MRGLRAEILVVASFILLVALPALLAFAAASDIFTMTIPNRVSAAMLAGFLIVAPALGLSLEAVALHMLAGLVVLVVAFGMFAAGWMGGGDAKLASASAVWLGFGAMADWILLVGIAGGLLTLGLLQFRAWPIEHLALRWEWLGRLHSPKSGIPYGIALSGAALAVLPSSQVWALAFR